MSGIFLLHENLQEALAARQWQPTPIQESAIPILLWKRQITYRSDRLGKDVICNITNLTQMYNRRMGTTICTYITPLRALNRDVDRRLQEVAEAVGLKVGLRHGDTTQSERAKQVRKPPHILVTTPETFN